MTALSAWPFICGSRHRLNLTVMGIIIIYIKIKIDYKDCNVINFNLNGENNLWPGLLKRKAFVNLTKK